MLCHAVITFPYSSFIIMVVVTHKLESNLVLNCHLDHFPAQLFSFHPFHQDKKNKNKKKNIWKSLWLKSTSKRYSRVGRGPARQVVPPLSGCRSALLRPRANRRATIPPKMGMIFLWHWSQTVPESSGAPSPPLWSAVPVKVRAKLGWGGPWCTLPDTWRAHVRWCACHVWAFVDAPSWM